MSQIERLYLIDQLLNDRKTVSFAVLQQSLGVSRATLKRDLEYLRSRLNAPIEWSREAGGYRFSKTSAQTGPSYALPGLWFNEREIHTLLTMQHILANLGAGGLLAGRVTGLMNRLEALLDGAGGEASQWREKILIAGMGRRPLPLVHFQKVGHALMNGQRIRLRYMARSSGETTERDVSPLRLVHYRENWYLDAWCHLRGELRNFSMDCIQHASVLEETARKVPLSIVDQSMGPAYGIFARGKLKRARLRFSSHRAKWVGHECWHPDQKGRWLEDGRYELSLPYADDREILMDILRQGAECEVLGPQALRQRVAMEAKAICQKYGEEGSDGLML